MAQALTSAFLQSKPLLAPPPSAVKPKLCAGRTSRGGFQVTCRKKDIHPEFHMDSKVYCNGELVMTTGGTQKEYNIDVWSGNHPFYLGNRTGVLVAANQVEKFRKKYAGLDDFMEIPVLQGEIVLPSRKKKPKKK
ncbi:50S ribosomal protein L31, chloroplastic [Linum grandiflorum]